MGGGDGEDGLAVTVDDGYDIGGLDRELAGTVFAGRVHWFPSVGSTNRVAMREADGGAPAGSVYLADEQTEGRGRSGRQWSSAAGEGLYASILLRPALAPADILWLSLAAGLAVRQAIHEVTSLEADIRWPNDLLLRGQKFCGILTELNAEVTRVRHAVVGIGINVHQGSFPGELCAATSLMMETGRRWRRQDLLVALLAALHRETSALDRNAPEAAAGIVERLEKSSSWIRGKRVHVDERGGYTGITTGLDMRGFLRVETANGVRTVLSGGVREQVEDAAKLPEGRE